MLDFLSIMNLVMELDTKDTKDTKAVVDIK